MREQERTDRVNSIWNQVEGNWNQFKGVVKEKWSDLSDDDLEQMEGRRDRLVGKIQERYGENQWKMADIERELEGHSRR
ncbi:MAG: CsbD family protein [Acidobacteria bacterium]|nr:CsbD family protein [Acidobacteriota bacterium]